METGGVTKYVIMDVLFILTNVPTACPAKCHNNPLNLFPMNRALKSSQTDS